MSEDLLRFPKWVPGAHLQTFYAALWLPTPVVAFRRERWNTPDGDFIDLDWLDGKSGALVVLFHGLEGSSRSPYARAIADAVQRRGASCVVVHFRGCSGHPNRLPRAYHSGDSAEIDWILRRLAHLCGAPVGAVGISLGANALLKWLGEQGVAAAQLVGAAAAVSAPLDLVAAGNALDHGFNRIYTLNFLRTLIPKSLEKLVRFPGLFDEARLRRARSFREFDDVVTAPVHGFDGVMDYWQRASSKPWLAHIQVPTLLLNARNDSFLPRTALPAASEVSAQVECLFPEPGGHVGFIDGSFPGTRTWLLNRICNHVLARISGFTGVGATR